MAVTDHAHRLGLSTDFLGALFHRGAHVNDTWASIDEVCISHPIPEKTELHEQNFSPNSTDCLPWLINLGMVLLLCSQAESFYTP